MDPITPAAMAPREMPRESEVKMKINMLLADILPGSTTLAETEMIAGHIFDMVEGWWKHGSVLKKQIPVPKPPVLGW